MRPCLISSHLTQSEALWRHRAMSKLALQGAANENHSETSGSRELFPAKKRNKMMAGLDPTKTTAGYSQQLDGSRPRLVLVNVTL